jgi:hypothetical protein
VEKRTKKSPKRAISFLRRIEEEEKGVRREARRVRCTEKSVLVKQN